MLNWIIQILHYYCSLQHKNIENSRIVEQNVAISLSLCSSLCLLRLALPSPSSTAGYYSVLGHSFERQKWSFVLYIVAFSALKMAFSKLNIAVCIKKPHIFHFFSYYRTSLQISVFYKFLCTNLSQVVLRRFYTERFV